MVRRSRHVRLERLAGADLEPPSHRRVERTHGRRELLREAGEARESWLHPVLALQTPSPPLRRWRHLAEGDPGTADHLIPTPLKPEEPENAIEYRRGRRAPRGARSEHESIRQRHAGDSCEPIRVNELSAPQFTPNCCL